MPENSETKAKGKGRPTPSRSSREAANRKPLVGDRTKEGREAARKAAAAMRARVREGQLNGDEKYLGPRDRGPQRRFARDYVDSRFTAGELFYPIVIVALVLASVNSTIAALASLVLLWGIIAVAGINAFFLARGVRKALEATYGEGKVERRLGLYVALRSAQMRVMRLPRAQVKRGTKIG